MTSGPAPSERHARRSPLIAQILAGEIEPRTRRVRRPPEGPTAPVVTEVPDGDGPGREAATRVADVVLVTDVDGFWFAVYDRAADVTDRAPGGTAPDGEQRIEVTAEALASALASVRRVSKHARGAAAQLIAADLGVPELAARLAGRVVVAFPVAPEELTGLGAETARVIEDLAQAPADHRPPVGHRCFADWDDLVLGTRASG